MTTRRTSRDQVDFALRRHFSAVFTPVEREVLVEAILDWDAQHEHLTRAERTEGWLALARQARHPSSLIALAR
jgi:hypothetical protein